MKFGPQRRVRYLFVPPLRRQKRSRFQTETTAHGGPSHQPMRVALLEFPRTHTHASYPDVLRLFLHPVALYGVLNPPGRVGSPMYSATVPFELATPLNLNLPDM